MKAPALHELVKMDERFIEWLGDDFNKNLLKRRYIVIFGTEDHESTASAHNDLKSVEDELDYDETGGWYPEAVFDLERMIEMEFTITKKITWTSGFNKRS